MSSSLVLPAGLRCEHDRVVLAWSDSTMSGEDRYCAGRAWEYGWIQGDWPPRAPSDAPRGPRRWFGLRPPARPRDPYAWTFTGEPGPDFPVECECACGCEWHGVWADISAAQGVLRCPDCVTAAHPPIGPWDAGR